MKIFNFILGALLIGVGSAVLFGTTVMISAATSKYPLYINLLGLVFIGAAPFGIGTVLWLKSGTMRNGKLMWFLIGFLAASLLGLTVAHIRMRPRDVTKSWPKELLKTLPPDYARNLQSAYCFGVGHWKIVASASPSNNSAVITPRDDSFPRIYILNDRTNGINITLQDSNRQTVEAKYKNGDSVFDWYAYSTGWSSNDFSVIDANLDGQMDLRMGPHGTVAYNINSNWYAGIRTNQKVYVEIDGQRKCIGKFKNGWTFKDDE